LKIAVGQQSVFDMLNVLYDRGRKVVLMHRIGMVGQELAQILTRQRIGENAGSAGGDNQIGHVCGVRFYSFDVVYR
jgi:hypothetical protein